MISKTSAKKKPKPCSCQTGKICKRCKSKKIIKPQVFIEEPRRLPVPIVISHYRENPIKFQTLHLRNWNPSHRREPPKETETKGRSICGWFKRYRTLRDLETRDKKAKKERQEKLKRERAQEREAEVYQQLRKQLEYKEKHDKLEKEKLRREKEVLAQLQQQCEYKEKHDKLEKERLRREEEVLAQLQQQCEYKEKHDKLEKERLRREEEVLAQLQQQCEYKEKKDKLERERLRKEKETKKSLSFPPPKTAKEKSASARPRAESRHVSAKSPNHYETFSYRFVNCCYRFCCQLYCWLTIIFIIGLVILVV